MCFEVPYATATPIPQTYFFKPNKCQAMIGKTNKTPRVGERCLYLQSDLATNCTSKSKSLYACIEEGGLILRESERPGLLRRVSMYTSNMPQTDAKSFSRSAFLQQRQLSFCHCFELCCNTIYCLAPMFRKIDISVFAQ